MRKPDSVTDREIVETLCEMREEWIAWLARRTKKGRRYVARWVRF
jgi:hypothetical protein